MGWTARLETRRGVSIPAYVGPLLKPVTLKITFAPRFSVERVSPEEYKTLAEAIGGNPNSVRTTLARKEDRFVKLPDGTWGLRAER